MNLSRLQSRSPHSGSPRTSEAAAPRRLAAGGLVLALLVSSPVLAWGPVAHQAVAAKAIETLPKGIKPFYKNHRLEMPTLSPEARVPEEGQDQKFAIDRLMPFPFLDFPRTEDAAKARFGDAYAAVGRLPWLIGESYAKLVAAFKSGDKAAILAESDTMAALVADIHNPLALTENFDGQKTAQHGLWARFATRLPEASEHRLKLDADGAHLLEDPKEYVFGMVNKTYIWLDNLLYEEELARRGKAGYTELYYESLEQRAGPILKDLLGRAASDTGSYWYTAWTAAGRPVLQ